MFIYEGDYVTKEEMKQLICEKIDAARSGIEALAADIESTPELDIRKQRLLQRLRHI